MTGYDFKSYKKPLNKYQKVKQAKQEEINRLLKEKHEKEEKERIALENETKKQRLAKIKKEQEALEKEIQDEKDRKKKITDRIKYIQDNYKLKDIEGLVTDLKLKLEVFDKPYRKNALEMNLSKEYAEIKEIYKVLEASDKNKRINRIINGILDSKPKTESTSKSV